MRILKSLFIKLLRFVYFLPVLPILVLLILIFGHLILGPKLIGSDNANFINLAKWLSDWFPRIPFWYPQEGGGISFTISYPILNHLVVVFFQKITNLPIAVVFRIWSLVSVFLSSIGLYLLTFRLSKNQTISAFASIFYTLAPITWVFLLGWGFSAEQLSYVYVPPILIILSLFLDGFYLNGFTLKTKIYFLIFVVSMAILPLVHPLIFTGTLMFSFFLIIIYPLVNFKTVKPNLKKILTLGLISVVTVFLLSIWWILPFSRYLLIAAQGASVDKTIYPYKVYVQNSIYAKNVFSITDKTATYESYDDAPQNLSGWVWRDISFPYIICILALVGLVGSFFLNRKIFAFGLANLIPLTIAVVPNVTYIFLKFPFSEYILNWRAAIVPSRFIIPLLAAFGCFVLSYLITFPIDFISKKINPAIVKYFFKLIFVFVSTILTISIAIFLLWKFRDWPNKLPEFMISYGPEISVPSSMVDLRNIWRKEVDYCFSAGIPPSKEEQPSCYNISLQENFWEFKLNNACNNLRENKIQLNPEISKLCDINPTSEIINKVLNGCKANILDIQYTKICSTKVDSFWDQINLDSIKTMINKKDLLGLGKEIFYYPQEGEILKMMPNDSNTRIDIGTSLGSFMMFEPFYSNVPELPVYYNQSTLIKTLWNYQIAVFNQKESVWPQDSILKELSKYFGLKYMLLSENLVPLDKLEKAGWERFEKWEGNLYEGLALWKNNESEGLLNASTKATILVIGQDKVDGYFRVFHLANLGAISFNDAIIVKGGPYVDVYSQEDLSKFDVVILEGYAYKSNNHSKGWNALGNYVRNGGSLLINTGWQYSSADWKVNKTPDFFPLKTLDWISTGSSNNYVLEDSEIVGKIDVTKFSPLIYGDKEWNVSSSNKSALRDWAKVGISVNGIPVVAGGKYGSGKIIWTGLDLPGHIGNYKDNEEEITLYKNLVLYLLHGKDKKILNTSFRRDYPDKLEIMINESSNQKTVIYWSEAYYPDFRAKLIENGKSKRIEVYKAGPGMTAFILPSVKAGSKIIYEYIEPLVITISKTISLITFLGIIIIIIRPDLLIKLKSKLPKIKRENIKDDEEDY